MGLETAKRGIMVNQKAIDIVGILTPRDIRDSAWTR